MKRFIRYTGGLQGYNNSKNDKFVGSNEIAQNGEYYTFQFTRAGAQNLNGGVANVSFNLSTV